MNPLTIAWRNIFRNKRRTAITVLAVALNTAVLIFIFAWTAGMSVQMEHSATDLVVGEAQIHVEGYLEDRSIYTAIPGPERLVAAARKQGLHAVARSYGFGLISAGKKSAGASFWGVEPAAEQDAFKLAANIGSGRYLGPTAKGGVVLGYKLARSLKAAVGAEIVTVVQAADGSMGNELFTVVGILKLAGDDIDRGAAILHRDDFEKLFLTGGRVHEIALTSKGAMSLDRLTDSLGDLPDGVELKTWRALLPMLSDALLMFDSSMWIYGFVFFLAAGMGVLNTMLMATHDRVREYGLLKALGTTPFRIVLDVATEAFVLALVSTAVGAALGIASGLYLEVYGLTFGELEMTWGGIAMDSTWYGKLILGDVIKLVLPMWFICVLAALYPAIKAARLDPVDAMTSI
jgi:ABC-type lipoprotein release transport system permease subunit